MKNGTLYATRLRKAYNKCDKAVPKEEIPDSSDTMRRLAVAVLGTVGGDVDGIRAVDRALATMIDWNEMRVSSPVELNRATGNVIPQGLHHCQRLILALQSVYERENRMSLDRLKSMQRRESRRYLEALEGVDEYTVASIMLWNLGGHAIPVHDRLLEALRVAELVHPTATRGEVQAFLERHIHAADAKRFCQVMRTFKAKHDETKKTTKRKVLKKTNTVSRNQVQSS